MGGAATTVAAVGAQIGEMRLGLQEQSLLPSYDGKIHRATIRDGIIFCEFTTPFDYRSIVTLDLATGKIDFPYSFREVDIARIISETGKEWLRLDNHEPNQWNFMSFTKLAENLNVKPETLRRYIPSSINSGRTGAIAIIGLKTSQFFHAPIPAKASLGMEVIAGSEVPLGDNSNQSIDTEKLAVKATAATNAYISEGLLRIPGTEPIFQVASRGAYQDTDKKFLSIDGDGVISEIQVEGKRAVSRELGAIKLPNSQKLEITGFSGIKGGKALYVAATIDGKSHLFAFDRTSLESLGSVEGPNGPICCDQSGNVIFIDSQRRLRLVSSNLVSLEDKKIVARNSPRLSAIKGAAAALDGLTLPAAEETMASEHGLSEEARELRSVQTALLKKLSPELRTCASLADVFTFQQRVGQLRLRPEFAALPTAFEPLELLIEGRKEELGYPELNQKIDAIEKLLSGKSRDLTEARAQFATVNELRSSVVLKDHEKRNSVGSRIAQIGKRLQSLSTEADTQAEQEVASGMKQLAGEIETCATRDEVLAVVMEGLGREIRTVIGQVSDKLKRDDLIAKLNRLVDEKINAIAEAIKSKQLLDAEERLKIREEYQTLLNTFARALDTVSDRKELQEQANSAVVRAARAQIEKLPEEEREEAHSALNRMLAERAKVIDFSHRVNDLSKTKGYVKFGAIEFPRAGDFEILFEPKFVPLKGRSGFLELVWIDARGKQYRPETTPVSVEAGSDERAKLIAQSKDEASKFFMSSIPRPPSVRSNWVINKHYEGYLGELSELLLYQKKLQQGLVIVEGDAGAAKSALVQMFAALTNRPLNTFACNGQTEKEDLTYLYQYDPEKGTYRLDSGFIEALQTPNTVILLEEVNSLPIPVAKMLNTLFDFRRELYLPDGRIIKADPSILIVGLQNPQSYAGVNKLSKEFLSRALVMEMDYAKYKEGSRILPYEAEMYSKYRPRLADLSQDEFYALWDKVVNGTQSALATRVSTSERELEVKGLRRLIDVANRARAAYRAFQREESTEPFEFIFSYREAEVIASLWNGATPIEKMIERIVLPKIPDAVEKKAMQALISTTAA